MAHILVIDDDGPLRVFLRTVLEGDHHHVLEASNGRLGLELYREQSTDLLITGLVMPELDGLTLIYELTRSFVNVKVIAMTGGGRWGQPIGHGQAVRGTADVTETVFAGQISQCGAGGTGAVKPERVVPGET